VYKQRIETSEGRIVTAHYLILATLFTAPGVGVPDILNRKDRPFVPLGEPRLHRLGGGVPDEGELEVKVEASFLALPKTEIWWLSGGRAGQEPGGVVEERMLAILYGEHLLRGRLRIGGHVRTSDFIAQRVSLDRPFDTLLDVSVCRLEAASPVAELPAVEIFEHVTINLSKNMGVFDLSHIELEEEGAHFTLEDETGELP
jgi:hypothetical protein